MATTPQRQYKYYEFIMAAFVAVYLCSNLIGPAKAAQLTLPWLGHITFGEGVDSLIFYPLAFYNSGLIPNELLMTIMLSQFVAKVGVEVLFTPGTYFIVGWLKRKEHEDYYDRDTDFTPFSLKT